MPFLMTYWKQLGLVILLATAIIGSYIRGHESGEAKIQAQWDAQKVLDMQAVAKAEAKTDAINSNSEKVTQDANKSFSTNLVDNSHYYNTHVVPTNRMRQSNREASSSEVSSVSTTTDKPNAEASDTISRADYEALANDCLATTIQLNNAQEWAEEQIKLDAD